MVDFPTKRRPGLPIGGAQGGDHYQGDGGYTEQFCDEFDFLWSHQFSTNSCLLRLFGPLTLAQTDPHSGTSAGNNLSESLS